MEDKKINQDNVQIAILAELCKLNHFMELQTEYLKDCAMHLRYLDDKKNYDW